MLRQPSLRFAFIWASEAAVTFDSFSFGGQNIVVSFGFTFMIALKSACAFRWLAAAFHSIVHSVNFHHCTAVH